MARLMLIVTLAAAAWTAGCQQSSVVRADPSEATPRDTHAARRFNALGVEFANQGKYKEAQDAFEAAVHADALYGLAHNNLGMVYFHQDDLYRAAWQFRHAAKLLPYHPEPLNNLGLVYEAAGKLDDAVAQYEQAQSKAPGNPQLLGNQARARLRRGDKDATTRGLLEEVASADARPEWRNWAREKLAQLPLTDNPSETDQTQQP